MGSPGGATAYCGITTLALPFPLCSPPLPLLTLHVVDLPAKCPGFFCFLFFFLIFKKTLLPKRCLKFNQKD